MKYLAAKQGTNTGSPPSGCRSRVCSLNRHGEVQAFFGRDQGIMILRILADVDLNPIYPAVCQRYDLVARGGSRFVGAYPIKKTVKDTCSINRRSCQVLFNHGSSRPWRRRSVFHPLPGMVSMTP